MQPRVESNLRGSVAGTGARGTGAVSQLLTTRSTVNIEAGGGDDRGGVDIPSNNTQYTILTRALATSDGTSVADTIASKASL